MSHRSIMKKTIQLFMGMTIIGSGALFSHPALAQYCLPSETPTEFVCRKSTDISAWWLTQDFTESQKKYLETVFYNKYIIGDLWGKIQNSMKQIATQINAQKDVVMTATAAMNDAQLAAESQLLKDEAAANDAADLVRSKAVGTFTTLNNSLAASDIKAQTTKKVLTRMMEDRNLLTKGTGAEKDNVNRLMEYKTVYCDPGDNNGNMKEMCLPGTKPENYNSDIDFTRTFESRLTLDIDYSGDNVGTATQDKRDINALGRNLYGYKTLPVFPMKAALSVKRDGSNTSHLNYLDYRAIAALRNVAANSFASIVSLKTSGSPGSATYFKNVVRNMGMSDKEADRYLGQTPSYYAQMEVLTKKLYQNPDFYAGLLDRPANVKRQIFAMKTIELTQNRDLFESLQRQEMLISLLLELEIRKQQRLVQNGDN